MFQKQNDLFDFPNPLILQFGREFFKNLPQEPGVYFFKDAKGRILYVGKAKNLKNRISSYKQVKQGSHSKKICRLVYRVKEIDFEICLSETEALLRENHYIAKYKPGFNSVNKAPEHYHYLNINTDSNYAHFVFSKEIESECQYTLGAFKSKNRMITRLRSGLHLLDFIQNESLDYESPHFVLRKTDAYSIPLNDQDSFLSFIEFLNGENKEFLFEANFMISLLNKRNHFTAFRLTQDANHCEENFDGFFTRHRELREFSPYKDGFIPKENLNDVIVNHLQHRRKQQNKKVIEMDQATR